MKASLIAETGSAFDGHTFATLIGYGASAVCPYLALEAIALSARNGNLGEMSAEEGQARFRQAIELDLLKIPAKRGVSTNRSYHGAQLFTALGLGRGLVKLCFRGTTSPLNGIEIGQVARDCLTRHRSAFSPTVVELKDSGEIHALPSSPDHEAHAVTSEEIKAMYGFRRTLARGEFEKWEAITQSRPDGPVSLRDLWDLVRVGPAIPREQVEDDNLSIIRHIMGGDMSYGALSWEAHTTAASGFNRSGSRSGSGEGGENPSRFGTETNSKIKQLAPGHFGATPWYLSSGDEVSIKMAQGAKPGEGGQISGRKVTEEIARARHTPVGLDLYSPAPHADIYSIEDFGQSRYDVRQVHPTGRVCGKTVSAEGIGTIASGTAKAGFDVFLVSGQEGGTGASPLGSTKHAGLPWEIGIADSHQTLVKNGLRDHMVLRVDGGIRTARDIVIAAILGSEEVALGTVVMDVEGCVRARVCHAPIDRETGKQRNCPVGVATQDPGARKKFRATPEQVAALLWETAESVCQLMASLGIRRFTELVGNTELLRRKKLDSFPEPIRSKIASLDLTRLTTHQGRVNRAMHPADFCHAAPTNRIDDLVATVYGAIIDGNGRAVVRETVTNCDRNIGTRVSGIIARRWKGEGLPDPKAILYQLVGSAGQSFAAYTERGMRFELEGEANDGVAKGLNGSIVIVRPAPDATFEWHENVAAGNGMGLGAISGEGYFGGQVGDRPANRNSGASFVAEGLGYHGCAFMTEGEFVSIGDAIGWNFGSGMTGGWAALYDRFGRVPRHLHPKDVKHFPLAGSLQEARVKQLITNHLQFTGSPRAREILERWDQCVQRFVLVVPAKAAIPIAATATTGAAVPAK